MTPTLATMLTLSVATLSLLALAFVVGASVGSFLNVCIHRIPEDRSVVSPGSQCPRCETPIAWYDNVPVLSWLLLGGRCRHCAAPIAVRYPLVEVLGGLLAVAALWRLGPTPMGVVAFAFTAALLLITFIDFDHFFIPDEVSLPGIAIGLGVSLLPGGIGLPDAVVGAALGGGLLWLVAWGYERSTGVEGMGFGDVKLLAMIGAFLGWQALPVVLLVASITGSLAGVLAIFGRRGRAGLRRVRRTLGPRATVPFIRRRARTTAIPFGPFLALGALVALYAPHTLLPWELTFTTIESVR
jgi:leader peptidase (prepilin peptidase) / N-methyltransferase